MRIIFILVLQIFLITACGNQSESPDSASNKTNISNRWYSADQITQGGQLYKSNCASCHGDEGEKLDAAQRSELRADYDFQQNIREHLQKMRTWPYDLSANIKYLIVFLANLAASVATVIQWMG